MLLRLPKTWREKIVAAVIIIILGLGGPLLEVKGANSGERKDACTLKYEHATAAIINGTNLDTNCLIIKREEKCAKFYSDYCKNWELNKRTQFSNIIRQQRSDCDSIEKSLSDLHKQLAEKCKKVGAKVTSDNEESDEDSEKPISTFEGCKEKILECATMDANDEPLLNLSTQMLTSILGGVTGIEMPVSQYNSVCKPLSEKKRETLEKKKESLPEKIKALSEKLSELQKEAEESQLKIKEEIRLLRQKAREEDLRQKEQQRKEESDIQNQILSAQKQIREIQAGMIQTQGEIAKAIAQRAQVLAKFTSAAVQESCLQKIQSVYQTLAKNHPHLRTPKRLRSANSVLARSYSKNQLESQMFEQCRKEMLEARNATLTEFESNIKRLEANLENAEQDIKAIQASLNMVSTQALEQKTERDQNTTQLLQERAEALSNLIQQLNITQRDYQNKIMTNQQELQRLQSELRKASMELATAENRPTESILPDEFDFDYQRLVEKTKAINECRQQVKKLTEAEKNLFQEGAH
ncbi:MAG: hypothetical protein NZ480_00320 [Bdellovibrionaceae bacterium]|nr:hypothetical protein [Pseudobdellovibrionaceae bacterium]MDW8190149.1 hypothetical protein [Pseudobdellovibrionaceae bacterium]